MIIYVNKGMNLLFTGSPQVYLQKKSNNLMLALHPNCFIPTLADHI